MMMGMSMLLIKHLTAKDSPLMIVFLSHLFMTPASSIPALLVWQSFPLELYLVLAGFAPFAFFGHFALAKAYSLADASFIAALDYARLPFAALIGWLMFAEFSDIWTWIGASIIFGSAFYIVRREVQLARQRASARTGE
jgi:drug/metabolite transporter (DMT)-like permease